MTLRYRLRTLLIVLALGPPLLAGFVGFLWIAVEASRKANRPRIVEFRGP
jgi:hypothetical protein